MADLDPPEVKVPDCGSDRSGVPRVLLVDDNALVRRLLREQLHARGALTVVGEAGDATTAVRLAADLSPDLVVLDLSMPGSDGFVTIAEIGAAAPTARVVVVSGFAAHEVEERVRAAGAAAYLEKGLRTDFSAALLAVLAAPSPRVPAHERAPGPLPRG